VPEAGQVINDGHRSRGIVAGDRVDIVPAGAPAEFHHNEAGITPQELCRRRVPARSMQERVDMPVHERLKNRRIHEAIVLVASYDQPEARLRQPILRDLGAGHEELVLQVGHHEPNRPARPLPQGTG